MGKPMGLPIQHTYPVMLRSVAAQPVYGGAPFETQ